MKYLLILVVALGSVTASCQTKSFKTNYPESLTKQDSTFIDNILRLENKGYIDSDVVFVEKHIQLIVYFQDLTRTYYLTRKGTIETMVECHADGNFINYGLESE